MGQDNQSSSYSPNTATADIFRFQRGEIEAGRPLAVPGRPYDEPGGGRPNQRKQQVRRHLSAVDGLLRMIYLNPLQGGLKKS
jgi:hypothetical protein